MSLYRLFLIVVILSWSIVVQAETFGRFAYVTNKADDTVQVFALHQATGMLVHRGYAAAGNEPYGVVVDPSGKLVFIVNRASGNISVFSIHQQTGALTEVAGSPYATGLLPYSLAIHPSGAFVYVANQGASTISAFSVDPDTGALTAVAGTPFATPAGPIALAFEQTGAFLYSANYSNNSVSKFAVDPATGALGWVWNATVGSSPSALSVHFDGRYAYLAVANSGSGSVSAFELDSGGDILQELQNSPFATGANPTSLAIGFDGYYSMIYAANYGSSSITGIRIHPFYKSLLPLDNSPYATGANPYAITVDPTGRFVYATCFGSNEVHEYRINALSSQLEPVSKARTQRQPLGIAFQSAPSALNFQSNRALVTHRFEASVTSLRRNGDVWNTMETIGTSDFTNAAVFHPGNEFAFHATNDSKVAQYTVNADDTLSLIGSDPVGQDPKAIAIDPTGRFAYTAEFNGGITLFSVDSQGAFASQATYAYNAGTGIVVAPTGRHLYLTRGGGLNQIAQFQVNLSSGALTFVQSVATGVTPTGPVFDPSGRFLYCPNYGAGTISVFSVNATTGALSLVSTTSAPANPTSLAVSALGDFLYAGGSSSTELRYYRIDASTGNLTYEGQIAAADYVVDAEVDFSGRFLHVLLQSGQIQIFDITAGEPLLMNTTELGFSAPTSLAITRETATTLFYDDFEDRDLAGWTTKGQWGVDGLPGALGSTNSPKGKIYAQFEACNLCAFEAEFRSIPANNRASMLAWYQNGANYVEIRLAEDSDKLLFKERVNAVIVSKANIPFIVEPNKTYILRAAYDGTNFHVYVNEREVLTIQAKGTPSGALGFKVKTTDGSPAAVEIESVQAY